MYRPTQRYVSRDIIPMKDLTLERGELFGWFEMGSTLLTFSQKGSIVPNVAVNQKVSFGDVLGKVK